MHYEQKLANYKYFQHSIFKALDMRFINDPIVDLDYAFTTKLRYKKSRSS